MGEVLLRSVLLLLALLVFAAYVLGELLTCPE